MSPLIMANEEQLYEEIVAQRDRRGVAVSVERKRSTFTFACVFLDTKRLEVLSNEVKPVVDFEKDWALTSYGCLSDEYSYLGVEQLNSEQIRENLKLMLEDVKYFYVRTTYALHVLHKILKIEKYIYS
jgi:hypothetical protein